jgi:uroporphyrinogen decarboxylase
MPSNTSLLVRAAFRQPVERTPVWVMRQAGRYLPQYREVRARAGSFLDLCHTPELAAVVSLQPLELMEVDAVIMFSDILTPLMGMGVSLDFDPGPVIHQPIREESDIRRLVLPDPSESCAYVGRLLNLLRQELRDRVPVIGFAGAPFTLASYLVAEEKGKNMAYLTRLLFDEPTLAHRLLDLLTRMTIDYLNYQIENGAQVIQLFDTWAGTLRADEFDVYALPYVQRIFSALNQKGEVPTIYYINGSHHLLDRLMSTGADVISLDWRADIGSVRARLGDKVALQGNLNPNVLFCDPTVIRTKTAEILQKFGSGSGHIFNLGHGIDKDVNPEHLLHMVRSVKELSQRQPT